tara:strand:- start:1534 stop:3408 length:1875 start_codon:yes stop_codon:yes gene_type:complete
MGHIFVFNPGTWPKCSADSGANTHLLQTTLPKGLNCNRGFDILFGMPSAPILVATLFSLPALLYCQGQDKESKAELPPPNIASVEDYRKHAMSRDGNPVAGEKLFSAKKTQCTLCHTTDGSGRMAGPDLAAAGDKFSREDLIRSILEPSANIMTGYSLSVITTKDNQILSGTLKHSSREKLVIAGPGDIRHRLAKSDIKDLSTSPVSMMPSNLYATLSKDEFSNLIAYLEKLKDQSLTERTTQGTPAKIEKLAKPIQLLPFFGQSLGLQKPVWFGEHPSIDNLFVVMEKSRARISILERDDDGRELHSTFLEIPEEVYVTNDEGLLGLAFHPNFSENRRYYFMHEIKDGPRRGMMIGERIADENLRKDSGKPTRQVLEFEVATQFHHGGGLEFGPDGFLYIGVGDGGPQEDPHGHAQDLSDYSGKLLRIDVDDQKGGKSYGIPRDNPFINHENHEVLPEIFAYGLRQPWRFSFDPANGELWVGDVGQNRFEEIAIVRAGENHGWNVYEGFELFSTRYRKEKNEYTPPVISFRRKHGVSITGGYVIRTETEKPSSFDGVYICADYQSRRIWGIRHENRKLKTIREIGTCPDRLVSFGQDRSGNIYAVGYNKGIIYRLDFEGAVFK